LAARIKQALGAEPELAKGASGVFDVFCDATLVFSNHREGRFPDPDEVIQALTRVKGG